MTGDVHGAVRDWRIQTETEAEGVSQIPLSANQRKSPNRDSVRKEESGERSQGKQPVGCATVIKVIFPFLEYYI